MKTPSISIESLKSEIENWKDRFGFDLFAWTPLPTPTRFSFYEKWISEGHHAKMNYLSDHLELKKDLRNLEPEAKSMISVGVHYNPHPFPVPTTPEGIRIAAYAKGTDYHLWLFEKLTELGTELELKWPGLRFLVATDSKPLLERNLAEEMGMGWVGKNTCLISREQGSFFLLGEVLLSLEIEPDRAGSILVPDFCGTCDKCLIACPTGALKEPRLLDSNLCISYLTIEAKEPPPEKLRSQIGDWFFGCDICQDVCPWNKKVFRKRDSIEKSPPSPEQVTEDLRFFLSASNREIEEKLQDSPLLRARPRGLRKNAMIVIGNLKLQSLVPEVRKYLEDPVLGELANWCLNQINQDPTS